jgi:hypothetical protein
MAYNISAYGGTSVYVYNFGRLISFLKATFRVCLEFGWCPNSPTPQVQPRRKFGEQNSRCNFDKL